MEHAFPLNNLTLRCFSAEPDEARESFACSDIPSFHSHLIPEGGGSASERAMGIPYMLFPPDNVLEGIIFNAHV